MLNHPEAQLERKADRCTLFLLFVFIHGVRGSFMHALFISEQLNYTNIVKHWGHELMDATVGWGATTPVQERAPGLACSIKDLQPPGQVNSPP